MFRIYIIAKIFIRMIILKVIIVVSVDHMISPRCLRSVNNRNQEQKRSNSKGLGRRMKTNTFGITCWISLCRFLFTVTDCASSVGWSVNDRLGKFGRLVGQSPTVQVPINRNMFFKLKLTYFVVFHMVYYVSSNNKTQNHIIFLWILWQTAPCL